MNIVVCVKQVVDTEAVIALDGAGEVELTGQTMVIDPYSEFAVERAVQLKEELGGTVTLLTLGSQDCLAAVRHGLAMGADAAVLIEDDQWPQGAQGRWLGPAHRRREGQSAWHRVPGPKALAAPCRSAGRTSALRKANNRVLRAQGL